MTGKSPGHSHQFTIADEEAVLSLLERLGRPHGSRSVDAARLAEATESAQREYTLSSDVERRAFFHGLLTGYAVGLKCK